MRSTLLTKKNLWKLLGFSTCVVMVLFTACNKEEDTTVIQSGPPEPHLPSQAFAYETGGSDMATLGRVLFYDKNLSLNNGISCGSCHIQRFDFADNHQFSRGLNNGYTSRNTSSLCAEGNSFGFSNVHARFWDGRAANVDTAVFMPVMNHVEMDMFNLNILPEKLSHLPYYHGLFQRAYLDSEITVTRIRTALATFVSNLSSHSNKFDRNQLNALENEGHEIFAGKGRCYSCHNGEDFNGYQTAYENVGLDVNYEDAGRGKITKNTDDDGKFNVPSLRNIALSAPYMHDGRYTTLREVIDHYSDGIQDNANLSWQLKDIPQDSLFFENNSSLNSLDLQSFAPVKMNLSEEEKNALEAFLKSLTDESYVTDPKFSDPF